MNGNYVFNQMIVRQRVDARLREAENERLAQLVQETQAGGLSHRSPRRWLAWLRRLPRLTLLVRGLRPSG